MSKTCFSKISRFILKASITVDIKVYVYKYNQPMFISDNSNNWHYMRTLNHPKPQQIYVCNALTYSTAIYSNSYSHICVGSTSRKAASLPPQIKPRSVNKRHHFSKVPLKTLSRL